MAMTIFLFFSFFFFHLGILQRSDSKRPRAKRCGTVMAFSRKNGRVAYEIWDTAGTHA